MRSLPSHGPSNLRRRTLLAGLASSVAMPWATRAQGYPEKPIAFVVPNAAGGAADGLARMFAEEMGRRLRQPIVVENLGGASGAIAAQKVLRAQPDGYTLLFGTTSDMVVTPVANRAAGYQPADFTAIVKVGVTPMVLTARPGLGIQTVDQLVEAAKGKPNALSIGSTGAASLQAFAAVAVQKAAGIDLLGVPYKGGAPLLNDILGGQLDLGVLTLPAVIPHARSGKLVVLGVLADQRASTAPDFPTVNESRSIKGVSVQIWAGLGGPPKLPSAIVERLNLAAQEVLRDREFTERRARTGDQAAPPAGASEFARFIASEAAMYQTLAAGMKLE